MALQLLLVYHSPLQIATFWEQHQGIPIVQTVSWMLKVAFHRIPNPDFAGVIDETIVCH